MCDSTQGSLYPSPMKIRHSKNVNTVTLFFQKLEPKVIDPLMTFDPKSVEVTCVTLPKDHCVQVPWKYIKVCGYSDLFSKTWTKGHWTLDDFWPYVCWGYMCDSTQGSSRPSPMKIHRSMWIQWPFFSETWTKGHWTQSLLCPSPMGIHQCMWIQWSILQLKYHHIYTYYILSGFWGEHRAILFRILELNKLKWDSYNAVFLMGYTCTCIYFNHWERCLLIESQVSNESNCHFWPLFIHFGKWPCDHNQPMALLQIPKNHKSVSLRTQGLHPRKLRDHRGVSLRTQGLHPWKLPENSWMHPLESREI